MITTIFSKSRPFNYILIISLLILCFILSAIKDFGFLNSNFSIFKNVGLLGLLIASLFITNFVTKRNGLSKDSTFPFVFFFAFVILFPSILNNTNLIISNFCILLAMRRLISLQSLVTPKEKIFDASLWIFTASLFHFWCVLFILLVFISIILHVSRDYRNWILPYLAFFAVAIIFLFFALVFDENIILQFVKKATLNLDFFYFTNQFQNISLSIYVAIAVLFVFSLILSLSKKPLMLHAAYKKIITCFFVGMVVFIVSPCKNNGILVFTFMPMAIMGTNFIENLEVKWIKEATMDIILFFCFLLFFLQL